MFKYMKQIYHLQKINIITIISESPIKHYKHHSLVRAYQVFTFKIIA